MATKIPKRNSRFVLHISYELRQRIEKWVESNGITRADFGREAFKSYLDMIKRQERADQLAESCKLFEHAHNRLTQEWSPTDSEYWPQQ